MRSEFDDRKTLAAFIAVIILGGINAIGIRFVVRELPPFWGGTLRFLPAALIMLVVTFMLRLRLPSGKSLLGALIFGVLNIGVSFGLTFWGFQKVPAGLGQVISSLVPLLTLLFAILHRQETFRWRAMAGSVLAVSGVALVFAHQVQSNVPLPYLLAVFLSSVASAEAGILLKNYPISHPIPTNAVSMLAGAAVMFLLSLLMREPHLLPQLTATWIALVYLILIGSCIVFMLAIYIIKQWKASTTAYIFVLMPFISVTASAILDQERISPVLLAGAALVLFGVYVGALSKAAQSAQLKPAVGGESAEGAD